MNIRTLSVVLFCAIATGCSVHSNNNGFLDAFFPEKDVQKISCKFDRGGVAWWGYPWGWDQISWEAKKTGDLITSIEITDLHLEAPFSAYISREGKVKEKYSLVVSDALNFYPQTGIPWVAPMTVSIFLSKDGEGRYPASLSSQKGSPSPSTNQFWGQCTFHRG